MLLRILAATAVTIVLVVAADPRRILSVVLDADPLLLIAAVVLAVADRVLMAHRWFLLIRVVPAGARVGFAETLRVSLATTFLGNFLPTSVGAEALRVFELARLGFARSSALASVLMDRILGVVSLLLAALAGGLLAPHLLADRAVAIPIALTALGAMATAVLLFSHPAAALSRRVLTATLPARFSRMADRLLTAMLEHGASRRTMGVVLVESVGVQALRISQAYVVGSALGLAAPFPVYVALVPLALLVLLLPVSVGGMGTGQAAFMLLFGRVGVPGAEAFTLGTLLLFLGLLGSLPGGVVYAWSGSGFKRSLADAASPGPD
ncbi:MAG TPA: lysylphosphatidylglycerol synthase transmembrane domain-containing protein [Vicinamibacterales bacterium]|nr:lysylphosphatidylglycerol synthase transmembrane domain-containing protein [Vicinamibacterales bacterium]